MERGKGVHHFDLMSVFGQPLVTLHDWYPTSESQASPVESEDQVSEIDHVPATQARLGTGPAGASLVPFVRSIESQAISVAMPCSGRVLKEPGVPETLVQVFFPSGKGANFEAR